VPFLLTTLSLWVWDPLKTDLTNMLGLIVGNLWIIFGLVSKCVFVKCGKQFFQNIPGTMLYQCDQIDEVSPNGWFFTLASLLKITKVTTLLCYIFPRYRLCRYYFWKKSVGQQFGRFFFKKIHLVTLVLFSKDDLSTACQMTSFCILVSANFR
jgi:hypothetical protein